MFGWGKTILIISLAFNLIILGMFAGRYFFKGGYLHYGMQSYLLRSIPEQKRDQVREIIEKYKKTHPRRRGRFLRDWPEFAEVLKAEQFERDKFLQIFDQKLNIHNQRWRDGAAAIADVAELLTKEERDVIISKIQKRYERKKRRHRW